MAHPVPKLKSETPEPAPIRANRPRPIATVANAAVPPLLAVALGLGLWELVSLSGWRPSYVLPGPIPVLERVAAEVVSGEVFRAAWITLGRAIVGYLVAIVAGIGVGLMMARFNVLRSALGSLITGLQTMPSVAWFPLAILLFQLGESAIGFVVVLGAAPSIANGLLTSTDHVPPLLIRAGRTLGASGFALYRHVIVPAA
ncbi:MAG: ABC transporter permease subunit, partial [Myxococcota bacterium]